MDKLVRPLAGVAIAAAACWITAAAGVAFRDRTAELRVSLQQIEKRVHRADAAMEREFLSDAQGTGVSAAWALDVWRPADDVAAWLAPAGFKEADTRDDRRLRQHVEQEFGLALPPDYRSFGARLALGQGSVCERSRCEVVVLAAPARA